MSFCEVPWASMGYPVLPTQEIPSNLRMFHDVLWSFMRFCGSSLITFSLIP
jgi:hypothetical protein